MTIKRVALALLFSSILSVSALAEGQRVILVLDASGSMRGKVDGKAKMDIAKQVVGKVLKTWNPEDDLGLVVYGHREKDNCSDIETVLPPGPLSVGAYMSPVKALKPKGKTPMTQAVRQAAEALKYREQKSTVILVSDGEETCEADPCAVARELEQAGIGLTVHTVGFGLDKGKATEQLKCMAEETGGIAVLADNAEELETAFKKTVEAKVEEPPPPPVLTDNFQGHARMAEGVELAEPYIGGTSWVFHKDVNGQAGEYAYTVNGAHGKGDVPAAGKYVVKVTTDTAQLEVPYVHEDGKLNTLDVTLNAGIGTFSAMLDETTPMSNQGATWVYSKADGTYLATNYGASPSNLFVAGDYKVKLTDGQAEAEVAFKIEPGKTTETVVFLGAGAVKTTAVYSPGGEAVPDGTAFEMYKKAGISGKGEWVTTQYGNGQVFKVPAGEYDIVVKLGLAEMASPVKVEAGKEGSVEINLNAGYIAATAEGVARYEVFAGKKLLDGSYKWLTTTYDPQLSIPANAGSYLVKAIGAGDAAIGEKLVEVKAGERTETTIP